MYGMRCTSLFQYWALVFISSGRWIYWVNIFLPISFVSRWVPQKFKCRMAAHCKYLLRFKMDFNNHYGSGAPIDIFCWEIFSLIRLSMYVKNFYFNHHILSNYYCIYQNYQLEDCNLENFLEFLK